MIQYVDPALVKSWNKMVHVFALKNLALYPTTLQF